MGRFTRASAALAATAATAVAFSPPVAAADPEASDSETITVFGTECSVLVQARLFESEQEAVVITNVSGGEVCLDNNLRVFVEYTTIGGAETSTTGVAHGRSLSLNIGNVERLRSSYHLVEWPSVYPNEPAYSVDFQLQPK